MSVSEAPTFDEALAQIATIIGALPGEIMFGVCLDDDGRVGEMECFSSPDRSRFDLPMEMLFHLPKELGAPGVMFVSKASSSVLETQEAELDFTRRMVAAAKEHDIALQDHFVVHGDLCRSMLETLGLRKYQLS